MSVEDKECQGMAYTPCFIKGFQIWCSEFSNGNYSSGTLDSIHLGHFYYPNAGNGNSWLNSPFWIDYEPNSALKYLCKTHWVVLREFTGLEESLSQGKKKGSSLSENFSQNIFWKNATMKGNGSCAQVQGQSLVLCFVLFTCSIMNISPENLPFFFPSSFLCNLAGQLTKYVSCSIRVQSNSPWKPFHWL